MEYLPFVKEFGLRSASRVGGRTRSLTIPDDNYLDLDRNYLDESVWKQSGDALVGFPKTPKDGDLIIDFTHGMDADPQSANHKRWKERLESIASRYGAAGDNSMWCAPTPDIISYSNAAKSATVLSERGRIVVRVPASLPSASLTIKLSGLVVDSKFPTPAGGTLYRKDGEAWITAPVLGSPDLRPPLPHLKRIYEGPVQNASWPKAEQIACVRLLQHGAPQPGFKLKIDLLARSGVRTALTNDTLKENWGAWQLFPTIPNRPAVIANSVEINTDPALHKMEVWAVD